MNRWNFGGARLYRDRSKNASPSARIPRARAALAPQRRLTNVASLNAATHQIAPADAPDPLPRPMTRAFAVRFSVSSCKRKSSPSALRWTSNSTPDAPCWKASLMDASVFSGAACDKPRWPTLRRFGQISEVGGVRPLCPQPMKSWSAFLCVACAGRVSCSFSPLLLSKWCPGVRPGSVHQSPGRRPSGVPIHVPALSRRRPDRRPNMFW